MSASFNTKHYTYHLGTSLELNACVDVFYYDSTTIYNRLKTESGLKASRPSIANIQETFDGIRDYLGSTGQFCHREDPDQDFELTEGGTKSPCFDTLIYVAANKKSVLGFTYFLGLQSSQRGESKIQNMYLNFKFSITNKKIDIKISYTLDPIWSTKDPLLSDYYAVSRSEILQASGPNPSVDYIRYSDDLLQVDSNDNFCCVTDCNALTRDTTWRFWIPTIIPMSRIKEYTNYTVGFWRGSLVLYRWNHKGEYTVDSLTSCNHFGVMTHVLDGQVFYGESESIRTFVSGVAILDSKVSDDDIRESCGYVSLTTNHWYVNRKKKIITNPWSESDKITIIDNNKTSEDLGLKFLLCPPSKYYFLQSVTGPWYKFKNEKTGSICWAGIFGSAYFDSNTEPQVFPWSDRILLKISGDYIEVYSFDYDGTLGNKEYQLGSKPAVTIPTEYLGSDYRPFLDSLRHRPLRPGSLKELHNSTVSFRGLLFYLDSGLKNIYYL